MGLLMLGLTGLAGATSPVALNRESWISVGDYPAEALSAHQEGRVAVRLAVKPDGRVSECDVTASSGAPSLDTATCGLIFVRARFAPAKDGAGHALPGTFATRVTWRYPR